ncbi:sulfate ABC transporter substrate-binding protein [bacterium]|nr:sulfate ABC transporter substrate-binding protein [candidate division CSSED10-310 bacterium]
MKIPMPNCMAIACFAACLFIAAGCSPRQSADSMEDVLIIGAYTVPKDLYQERLIPGFQAVWKEKTGRNIRFEQSYAASGAQARAIIGGFEADIAALSLAGDIDRIVDAGLMKPEWIQRPGGAFVSRSVVVIGFREGNPLGIDGWDRLMRDDIELICPNPKTSGGAQWNINAVYSAGLVRSNGDPAGAADFLKSIVRRITVMDKGARGSMTTYEQGVGNAILTYENEALLRIRQGKSFPFIIPETTMLIENPIAVVHANAARHGVVAAAEAFVDYLFSSEAQRAFAEYGFRSVNSEVAAQFAGRYPDPVHLKTIADLGGWDRVKTELYGPDGVWSTVNLEINQAE